MRYNFEELCLPCYDELVAYAAKRTKDKEKALDIVQDSVLRAIRSWDNWEPQGDPKVYARAWMYRIVSNTFALQYKRDKIYDKLISINHMKRDSEGGESESYKYTATTAQVVDSLHQTRVEDHPYYQVDSIGDEVRQAMERIRPEWAEIVRLHYIEGVPAHEIAEMLNLAPGTVRSRMARGRLALARILSPYSRQRFGFGVLAGDGADEAAPDFESPELPESEADGVECVVADDDGRLLGFA